MGPITYTEPVVKKVLTAWFQQSGDLFVELYLPHGGGSGEFFILTDYSQFEDLMARARPGSICFVLREQQLPVRGQVTETLISQALDQLSEGYYYIVAEPSNFPEPLNYLSDGDSRTALKADLEKLRGKEVWIGPEPSMPDNYWHEHTGTDALIAVKPKL